MTIKQLITEAKSVRFVCTGLGTIRQARPDGTEAWTPGSGTICPIAAVANKLLAKGATVYTTQSFMSAAHDLGLDRDQALIFARAADGLALYRNGTPARFLRHVIERELLS